MAYQNVGTPRIFIDYYSYHNAIGNIDSWGATQDYLQPQTPGIFMNPLIPCTRQDSFNASHLTHYNFNTKQPIYGVNFYAMLGHNMGGIPVGPFIEYSGTNFTGNKIELANNGEEIINFDFNSHTPQGRYGTPRMNGFSMWKFPEITADMAYTTNNEEDVQLEQNSCASSSTMYPDPLQGSVSGTYTVGFSPVCGRIYDFEHAPDMKVKMTREFDGIKRQKTIGGADISNTTYLGPPNWRLSGNPWTLTEADIGAIIPPYAGARMGRRTWELKFSMMSDRFSSGVGGLMTVNENVTPYGVDTSVAAGYTEGVDYQASYVDENGVTIPPKYLYDSFTDSSFMGLVYGKTMGFSLPIIFQADKNNNSADQFCIAKIDDKSLKITQSSFKKYDISLKIREIW